MEYIHNTRGTHIIVDAYGIDPTLLDSIGYLKQLGRFAIAVSGAEFVGVIEKKFTPYGTTLLFLLSESHLSFHTYVDSEKNKDKSYIAIDLFTCGSADSNAAIDYIIEQLKPDPNRIYRQTIVRGVE